VNESEVQTFWNAHPDMVVQSLSQTTGGESMTLGGALDAWASSPEVLVGPVCGIAQVGVPHPPRRRQFFIEYDCFDCDPRKTSCRDGSALL
jgi:hypothetical protein